jgi:hypothetical protein
MTNSAKIVSVLLVVAATSGSALAATSIAANPGPGSVDTSRGVPLNLPPAKAIPLPRVDLSTISRGPLDAAGAEANYVSVTLNRDGSTEETTISEELRAIIERMMAAKGF